MGEFQNGVGDGHGFLLSGGRYATLDVPGIAYTAAQGINASGQIVGTYSANDNDGLHAFRLNDGHYTTFEVPGSIATLPRGINDSGQIVGYYATGPTDGYGFLLTDGVYTTISVPGSIATIAEGINNLGQIVGEYLDASGNHHGFLATPVPEPSTLLLLAVATLGVIGRVWLAPPEFRKRRSSARLVSLAPGPFYQHNRTIL